MTTDKATAPAQPDTNDGFLLCQCGWFGISVELTPHAAEDGLWGLCPKCGHVEDDMEVVPRARVEQALRPTTAPADRAGGDKQLREALIDCIHTLKNAKTDEPEWASGSIELAQAALAGSCQHLNLVRSTEPQSQTKCMDCNRYIVAPPVDAMAGGEVAECDHGVKYLFRCHQCEVAGQGLHARAALAAAPGAGDEKKAVAQLESLKAEINRILHPNCDGPKAPAWCDLLAYMEGDFTRLRSDLRDITSKHADMCMRMCTAERDRDIWREKFGAERAGMPSLDQALNERDEARAELGRVREFDLSPGSKSLLRSEIRMLVKECRERRAYYVDEAVEAILKRVQIAILCGVKAAERKGGREGEGSK